MLNKSLKKNLKLYKASAGSGKTYTLVKEFLTLCLSSENILKYRGILAVTFTNKAANELKAKLLNYLDGIINDDPNCSDMKNDFLKIIKIDEILLKERAKLLYDDILHNYSDLNVSTIDSFIQQVSRSFAKELNLPSQYKVVLDNDDILDDLIQRIDSKIGKDDKFITYILSKFLKYNLSEENTWHLDAPIKDFLEKLLKEGAYKKGESFNIESIDENQYDEIEDYLDKKISTYNNSIKDNIENIISFNNNNSLTLESDYNKVLSSFLNKINDNINIEPKNLINKTLKDILNGDKNWNKNKKICVSKTQSIQLLNYFSNIIEAHSALFLVNIVKKNLYLYVMRGTLFSIINQYIEETNNVHISEFNKRISDIIDDCSVPFIYERIGSRYKHFFIDEFQDTSVLQWFNFLPLINNSLSEGYMNLLVGDAKQAIYRFRSGEVEQIINLPKIYKRNKKEFFDECEYNFEVQFSEYSLDTNYRSKKNIINFNNSFFKNAKSQLNNEDYKSVYTKNMEQKYRDKKDYEGYVKTEIFKSEYFIEEGKKRADVKKIKESINYAMLKDINILKDKGFKYSDITILVRSNSDGTLIADFLAKNEIPVISSESILLKSSDKVQLIILTLKYFMDADNDVVRLSLSFYQNLLRETVGDDEKGASLLKKSLSSDIEENLLTELRSKSLTIYDLCVRIMKMYGMNTVEDVFLQYFMNAVHDWQNNENGDIKSFLDFWEKKSDSLFVKITGKIDAVQIMSIHKSKGLEFKVVLYPYAITKIPDFHTNEKWLSFKDDFDILKDIPHLDNFILPVKSALVGTSMEEHYNEEYEKAAFDDINIMYVAMTRPKELLFIYTDNATSKDNPNNLFLDYFSQKIIESNNDILEFEYVSCDDKDVYSLGELMYSFKEDEKSEELNVAKCNDFSTIDWLQMLRIEPDTTMFWKNDEDYNPREWGILVHEIFSKINTIDDAPKILKRYVNDGCIDQEQSDRIMRQFMEVVEKKEVKAAYSRDVVVKNEMDILDADGNIMRPDRYVELKDKVILIDYKTGAQDVEHYQQLRNYMIALQDMIDHKEIEALLIYIGKETKVEQVYLDRLF